jgi:hypothetical protein
MEVVQMSRITRVFSLLAPAALLMACDSTDPNGQPMTLSFSSQAPATSPALTDVVVTAGTNSVVITRAQLVVRRIKLKPTVTAAAPCTDDDATDDDCAEISAGPVLVDLPLTGSTVTSVAATVPAGTYSEVDFRIHKPSDDAADLAFRTANPAFAGVSIRVEGTYNGAPFVYTTDLTEKQEVEFNPAIVIDESGTNPNITIQVDVSSWFRNGTAVVDPATANKGGANENLVKNNIRASLRAFRDDDRNGR